MNFLLAGPLGLVDCILLVAAIARITHKRIQELRDPTLGSFLAALFAVAVSVFAIAFAVTSILMIFAALAFLVFGHPAGVGVTFIFYFVGLQVFMLAGVVVGYLAGPSFSRMIWTESPDDSDRNQD
jgi:hypothetical protein